MPFDPDKWVEISPQGDKKPFSRRRDSILKKFSDRFGVQGTDWDIAWKVGGQFLDLHEEMTGHYEKSYHIFLQENPAVLRWLVRNFKNVYDDSPTNVKSGFNYDKQETRRNHFQDIAIRRVVDDLGEKFKGKKLLQLRGKPYETEGGILNPGFVPFHDPGLIPKEKGPDEWYEPSSVEAQYQRCRTVVRRVA